MEFSEKLGLNAATMARSVLAGAVWLFVPLFLASVGFPPAEIGLAIGLGSLARLISAPFVGTLNDMLGTRRLIQASLIGLAAGTYFVGEIAGGAQFWMAALPIIIFSVSGNSLLLSLEASIYKKSGEGEVAGNAGEFNAIKQMTWGICILAGGFVMLWWGFGMASKIATLAAVAAFPFTFGIKHTFQVKFSIAEYLHELKKPGVVVLSALVFAMAFDWGAEGTALAPLLNRQYGMDSGSIGIVQFLANVALALASFYAGRHMIGGKAHGGQIARKALVAGMLIGCLGALALAFSSTFETAVLSRMGYNVGEAIMYVSISYLIGTTFSKNYVGGANGMMNLTANFAMMCASFSAGLLMGASPSLPFVVVGGILFVGAIIAWKSMGETK